MSAPDRIDSHTIDQTTELELGNFNSSYALIKRQFDLALILLFSPLFIPLMLVTAVLIKIESEGPIFFWQKRVGLYGKTFNMVKFRSMSTDSEANGSQFAKDGDLRVTRLGRFTRKMRIDELPQLWNIVRGEMSLIGPRPEQELFVNNFIKTIPEYSNRHAVRPGITGLAQVEQGYVDDSEGTRIKLKYDLSYINNLSFSMDMRIIGKTIFTMATGFGAR